MCCMTQPNFNFLCKEKKKRRAILRTKDISVVKVSSVMIGYKTQNSMQ